MTVEGRKGSEVVTDDETPFNVNVEKIPTLRPAFNKDGTVTAATSSSISDGAAALVLMTESEAKKRGAEAARAHRRLRVQRARAGVVHHRPGRRHQESPRQGRLEGRATWTCSR